MITAALIIKILLSSLLGYLTLNSFFKYHFSSERFQSIAFILAMIVMFIFKDIQNDTQSINIIIIIIASIAVLYLVLFLIFNKKKQFGYFLLNATKKDYPQISEDIKTVSNELDLEESNIKYNIKTPFYIEIQNIEIKKVVSFFKKIDSTNNSRKKLLTMSVYWHAVAFLILMVAIWRF